MTQINLLPWRAQLQEEHRQYVIKLFIATAVVSLFLVVLIHLSISSQLAYQNDVNTLLQTNIQLLDVKIKEIKQLQSQRQKLVAHMNVIQDLQTNRAQVVHFFDQLVKIMPPGIYLTRIKRAGNLITLEGKAESNTIISTLMRRIDACVWMGQPMLNEIKTNISQLPYSNDFTLQLQLKFAA